MPKSLRILAKKINDLIDRKAISKTELSRKSKIARTNLDLYLKETSIPRIDALDKLADALDITADEIIRDDQQPIRLPHTLQDCYAAIGKAIQEPTQSTIPQDITETITRLNLKTRDQLFEIIRIFPTLDDRQKFGFLEDLRGVQRVASSVGNKEKKIK